MSEHKDKHKDKPNHTTKSKEEEIKIKILNENIENSDLTFKLIVIGDSGVGKSCITKMAIQNKFDEETQATVGFEFYTFNLEINSKKVQLQTWDTCGQESYKSLISNFYRNTGLSILVYSVTSRESFENIHLWLKELKSFSSPDILIFLIGNKTDLVEERVVSTEEGESLAREIQANAYIESSAKTGFNVNDIFTNAGRFLYIQYTDVNKKAVSHNKGVKLNSKNIKKNGKCC